MFRKTIFALGMVPVALLLAAVPSWATADSATVALITTGASDTKDTVMGSITPVMPYAAALFAVGLAWAFVRKLLRSH